jgi:cell division protein FtsN
MRHPAKSRPGVQRGGFFLGLIVGLLIGLAASLGVALYVTKVPVPFVNKVPQRSPEQDAAQAEKNRNWDPNGPLAGKSAVRAPPPASAAPVAAPPPPAPLPSAARPARAAESPPAAASAAKKDARDAAGSVDRSASAGEAFTYFVQAGAYAHAEDAEQQRANLALIGLTAKVTEREQSGRTVYRVRLGPYERKDEADATKEKLAEAGVDAALVRVQR